MSDSKLSHNMSCPVQGCKSNTYKKGPGVTFHQFPSNATMWNKWFAILKNKCTVVSNWNKVTICSRHFEHKYFDGSRKLKSNAVPTLFPAITNTTKSVTTYAPRAKVERLLNRLTQAQLTEDIKQTMRLVKVPHNFSDCVDDNLQCVSDTPVEAQLWLLVKKQDHLVTRLTQQVAQSKKQLEVLQKNMENKSNKRESEESVQTYKYHIKCLQEKHATLEEQIEILTAVESR